MIDSAGLLCSKHVQYIRWSIWDKQLKYSLQVQLYTVFVIRQQQQHSNCNRHQNNGKSLLSVFCFCIFCLYFVFLINFFVIFWNICVYFESHFNHWFFSALFITHLETVQKALKLGNNLKILLTFSLINNQ